VPGSAGERKFPGCIASRLQGCNERTPSARREWGNLLTKL